MRMDNIAAPLKCKFLTSIVNNQLSLDNILGSLCSVG